MALVEANAQNVSGGQVQSAHLPFPIKCILRMQHLHFSNSFYVQCAAALQDCKLVEFSQHELYCPSSHKEVILISISILFGLEVLVSLGAVLTITLGAVLNRLPR